MLAAACVLVDVVAAELLVDAELVVVVVAAAAAELAVVEVVAAELVGLGGAPLPVVVALVVVRAELVVVEVCVGLLPQAAVSAPLITTPASSRHSLRVIVYTVDVWS